MQIMTLLKDERGYEMDMNNRNTCNFLFSSDKKKFTAEDVFGSEHRDAASDERLRMLSSVISCGEYSISAEDVASAIMGI